MRDGAAIARVAAGLGGLDVLVNNAGANTVQPSEWDPDVFEESLRLNLGSAFRMATAVKPLLAKSALEGGASIVNLASMSSFFAVPIVPGYGAAKAGVVQMTKNLAVAWAKHRIRVNAVAPGLILSNMTRVMKGIDALEKPQLERTPLGRWGTPEDVAPAVLFLASAAAGFVTGHTLCVDGGYAVALSLRRVFSVRGGAHERGGDERGDGERVERVPAAARVGQEREREDEPHVPDAGAVEQRPARAAERLEGGVGGGGGHRGDEDEAEPAAGERDRVRLVRGREAR